MPWSPVLTHTAEKTAYWAAESKEAGTNEVIQPSTTLGCWDVTLRYARTTPVGTREDDATIGLRIAKVIGGGLYGLGLNSELSTIEARLNTLQATLATFMSSSFTLAEYIWHVRRASNPAAKGGGEKPGYELGVWSYPKQAFMPVWQVQVDNIVDIQRRRRAKQRSYAKLITS
jgi:hypothetical protein